MEAANFGDYKATFIVLKEITLMKRFLALIYLSTLTANVSAVTFSSTLERTGHGIVHVTAKTYKGIGFGVGYAYTEDNRCLLAHRIAQVNGRLAEQLGPDIPVRMQAQASTMSSQLMDGLFRTYLDTDTIRAGFNSEPQAVRDLAEGYAAGVNQYLKDKPNLTACTAVNFTGDVTVDDVYRMWMATAGLLGVEFAGPFLAIAQPIQTQTKAITREQKPPTALAQADLNIGSNALAIGRDGVSEGGPLHLYNPHFPWEGIQRTYVVHARIPGELDVMGPTLGGFPLPVAGFNRHIVWGLTLSPTQRVTLMQVGLLANDPTSYLVDGEVRKITTKAVPVKVAGETEPRNITIQMTPDGPIVLASRLGLGGTNAFIVKDVNLNNTRLVNQWLNVAKAKTVRQVRASLQAIKGVPWSYTTAVDSKGDTFFGEISSVPNIPTAQYESCNKNLITQGLISIVMDGSRSECYPKGTLDAKLMPSVIRPDYVANSNNNFEIPNADVQLTVSTPAFGPSKIPLQLRPSLALKMVEDRLAGTDGLGAAGFTAKTLKNVFDDKRNYAAELVLDDVLTLCKANPTGVWEGVTANLVAACNALSRWDRKHSLTSRGAHVFGGLWMSLRSRRITPDQLFATKAAFDAPLTTPTADLTADSSVRSVVLASLARVVLALQAAGVAPDAQWGDVHFVTDQNGNKVGLPGGPSDQGIYDAMASLNMRNFDAWVTSLKGFTASELTGSSYSHIVELTPKGPEAMGILAFSQATEATSPWYFDQLPLFSNSEMFKFPFTPAAIKADLKSRKVFK